MSIGKKLLDILFPSEYSCKGCGREIPEGTDFCDKCKGETVMISGRACTVCGTPLKHDGDVCFNCKNLSRHFDRSYAVFSYTPAVRQMIISFKSDNAMYLKDYLVGKLCEKFGEIEEKVDLITFVPMTEEDEYKRGYNQSEVLAVGLSEMTGVELFDGVFKVRSTNEQKRERYAERRENVKGAFSAEGDVKGKTVLVIDDKYTTGATLSEIARVLKKKGAVRVVGLMLAVSDEIDVIPHETIENI